MPKLRPIHTLSLVALAAIALAGCSKPASPLSVSPVAVSGNEPAVSVRPAVQPRISIRTTPDKQAVADEIIVRFKGEPRELPGASFVRALEIPDTYVYRLKQKGYAVQAADELEDDEDVIYVEPNFIYKATALPNDAQFAGSWGVGAVKAPNVWSFTRGQGVKVAVIDTGVNADHPDLYGRVLQGADTINNDDDATDDQGHGTHVAGTIAALANNGIGVAGVAPEAMIIPIKVLDHEGFGTNASITDGILKAVSLGARVINLSLGSEGASDTVARAVSYAQSKGVAVIAAAGNEKSAAPFYPAAFDGVIAVAAVDKADTMAYFSNRGDYVDVAAPGTDILSTGYQNNYVRMQGTSMACPHVAGAAALLVAQHPALKGPQLLQLFKLSGHPSNGFPLAEQPRVLDVASALEHVSALDLTPPSAVAGLVARGAAPGEVALSWDASSDNTGVAGYKVFRNDEQVGDVKLTFFIDSGLSVGEKATYKVVAYDLDGNEAPAGSAVVGEGGKPSAIYTELKVTKKTTTEMTITWKTAQPVQSQLQWGLTGLDATTALEAEASTSHSVTLKDLKRFKKYRFRVVGTDAAGEKHYSEAKSGRTKLWWLF